MRAAVLFGIAWLLAAGAAYGHEVRPAYLELREMPAAAGPALRYDMLFKVPARGDRRLGLHVRLPDGCRADAVEARFTGGAHVQRWRATCERTLVGQGIAIDGLADTRSDALARFERADGSSQTVRLTPERARFTVAALASRWSVARTYAALGTEHIVFGFDHLCFVLALLFLVGSGARLLGAVTAFTVAHSLTLGLAALGRLTLPQAPVEAVIAASVVFLAAEVARRHRDPALPQRAPWLFALAFGLLHGLGFAGALRELGLPEHAIPIALAAFNIGVELGQVAFVAAVLALLYLARAPATRFTGRAPLDTWEVADLVSTPAAYAIGCIAAFWLIERTAGFFAA